MGHGIQGKVAFVPVTGCSDCHARRELRKPIVQTLFLAAGCLLPLSRNMSARMCMASGDCSTGLHAGKLPLQKKKKSMPLEGIKFLERCCGLERDCLKTPVLTESRISVTVTQHTLVFFKDGCTDPESYKR